MRLSDVLKEMDELAKGNAGKQRYDLELEMGGMVFRLDIENLDKLMKKFQNMDKALGGS
ncbi:hypothetical protein MOC17_20730 [Bacillus haynesii]|uniref:hypothetical protein n=1 Tax=Bacillus haynesii TaxID=1925021 RepID=UPI0022810B8E|nr:hypothetical protein [Bacillus haynesii]MCY8048482.1 hypothetical protein [Bacillus haynesii]